MYVCAEGLHLRALAGPGGSCSARPGPKFLYKQTGQLKKVLKFQNILWACLRDQNGVQGSVLGGFRHWARSLVAFESVCVSKCVCPWPTLAVNPLGRSCTAQFPPRAHSHSHLLAFPVPDTPWLPFLLSSAHSLFPFPPSSCSFLCSAVEPQHFFPDLFLLCWFLSFPVTFSSSPSVVLST